MLKKRVLVLILCFMVMFGFSMDVFAAAKTYKLKKGKNIYFSSSGKYCSSACGGGLTVYKYL